MSYSLILDGRVQKDLEKLEPGVIKRIDAAIRKLASDPRPAGSTKLQGRQREGWRVRVGNYRILYHETVAKLDFVVIARGVAPKQSLVKQRIRRYLRFARNDSGDFCNSLIISMTILRK